MLTAVAVNAEGGAGGPQGQNPPENGNHHRNITLALFRFAMGKGRTMCQGERNRKGGRKSWANAVGEDKSKENQSAGRRGCAHAQM